MSELVERIESTVVGRRREIELVVAAREERWRTQEEMRAFCGAVDRATLANLVEQGETPLLSPAVLEEIGYKLAAYPLTLQLAAQQGMIDALAAIKAGHHPQNLASFTELQAVAGFPEYFEAEKAYAEG